MLHRPLGASRRLRWAILSAATVAAMLATSIDHADARGKRKRAAVKRTHQAATYNPRAASIVIDAKTGNVLQESNADGLRHPASLTKIMTLYLLFERLEAGQIALNSRMEVSEHASVQAPTKLGLRPGQTLAVEDAIKALVTKSANDAAVVIGETIGGTESEFARMMTRKARALGMKNTIYRNASGLPNDEQVTTAREQAMLGMAIQERFPRYYRYFATPSFTYAGRPMRNHNRLLGHVEGVDGIKTGYTNASGFNLVTSMRRGDRHVVAVVLGGATGAQRDARMRSLLETHIAEASTGPASKTRFADAETISEPTPASAPARTKLAAASSISLPPQVEAPAPAAAFAPPRIGSSEPIKPTPVKTVAVTVSKPAPVQVASADPVAVPAPARKGILGVLPVAVAAASQAVVGSAKAEPVKMVTPTKPEPQRVRSGWAIQIGAYEAETEAKQKLSAAKSKAASLLGRADPYTERTSKGVKTFYRARFAGLDKDQAQAACRQLKRSDMACMPLKI